MKNLRVIVVGGGPSGMIAAIAAAEQNATVILLERNGILGKKLGITGKGRCNLTNDCSEKELVENIPGNGKFLFSAFHRLNSQKLQDYFLQWGVELKIERGKRVFPASDKAETIIQALRSRLLDLGVEIRYNQRVKQLWIVDNTLKGVITYQGTLEADRVILATGGSSYPTTGSTGDGYPMAREVGHNIIAPRPALVPIEIDSPWNKMLQGLSLKNVNVAIQTEQKILSQEFGEMLFTHFGVSGPVILSLSRTLLDWDLKERRYLSIDLKPALSIEQLDARIQRDFQKNINKHFRNSLSELLPLSMIPVIIEACQIAPDKSINSVTKEERMALVTTLKDFRLRITGLRPLEEAIVTAGGVDVREIDPKTMASKIIKGLYIVGELLDIDGYTGGFNLQAAFSSGYVAGISCVSL
jgi:hypothetical protein